MEPLCVRKARVNIKSLTAESRAVRKEENRIGRRPEGRSDRAALSYHRRVKLRQEARAAYLAYAFIRGRRYRDVEAKAREPIPCGRILKKFDAWGYSTARWQQATAEYRGAFLWEWTSESGQFGHQRETVPAGSTG